MVCAARGRPVVDFGAALTRRRGLQDRAHSRALRAPNLLAARQYGIPTFRMAHSFVQAFDSEVAAFEAFARLYPATTI